MSAATAATAGAKASSRPSSNPSSALPTARPLSTGTLPSISATNPARSTFPTTTRAPKWFASSPKAFVSTSARTFYDVCGNHDRSGIDAEKNWWWHKWLDPMGEFSSHSGVDASKRTYPTSGTWERYSFQVGNVLFLMMSDINEPTQRPGRDLLGGNPGGVVSGETFEWWKNMVESNQDKIIVSTHHYMLKNTTVASGEWEGMRKDANGTWRSHYHGYKALGSPQRRVLSLLGGRRSGCAGIRKVPRSAPRRDRPMARRPYPHLPGRHLRRKIPRRNKMGCPLRKRLRPSPPPRPPDDHTHEPPLHLPRQRAAGPVLSTHLRLRRHRLVSQIRAPPAPKQALPLVARRDGSKLPLFGASRFSGNYYFTTVRLISGGRPATGCRKVG